MLTERRPRPALEMLAARSSVPVVLDRRLPSAHEAALYFVAAEALTNVTKYAIASAFEVALQRADPWAEIAVTDDGVGGARTDAGGGLRGLCDRVEALSGHLTLASPPDAGTTVRARIPVATPRPA